MEVKKFQGGSGATFTKGLKMPIFKVKSAQSTEFFFNFEAK